MQGAPFFVAAHRGTVPCCGSGPPQGRKGIQHRHIQSADAAEGVGDALLFGPQLGGVVHVPQAAAAAGADDSAVRRDAVRRRGEQLVQDAEGIPAAVLDDTHLSLIAGGSTRDEDGLALRRVGNAAAVAGKTLDAEGEKLVFL